MKPPIILHTGEKGQGMTYLSMNLHKGKYKGQVADPTVPLPPRYQHMEDRGYKALKYGHTINMRGPGLSTRIMDEIRGKQKNNESVVITVTGPPGKGKTYLALRWAQKLDQNFHIIDTPPPKPKQDHGQVTFDRKHIQYLVGSKSPLKRGQVIVMDEFHFGGGARGWQKADQQKLVNLIAAIRSKGYVLIIVVLHTKMVDSIVRNFVLNYEFKVKSHGRALAYRRWFPDRGDEAWSKRLGPMEMQMPDEGLCNGADCFKCASLHYSESKRCETLRAIYERRKEWFLNKQTKENEDKDMKADYQEIEEVIVSSTIGYASLPLKVDGTVNKTAYPGWARSQGIKVRHRDVSYVCDEIDRRMSIKDG